MRAKILHAAAANEQRMQKRPSRASFLIGRLTVNPGPATSTAEGHGCSEAEGPSGSCTYGTSIQGGPGNTIAQYFSVEFFIQN